MIKSKVALIGYGYVGKGMHKIFPDAILYDIDKGSKDEVNQNAELAIVCVPTPIAEDGSCDASIVEEAVCWLNTPYILIKSTVSPGTTDKFRKKFVFLPNILGKESIMFRRGNTRIRPILYPTAFLLWAVISPMQKGFCKFSKDVSVRMPFIALLIPQQPSLQNIWRMLGEQLK